MGDPRMDRWWTDLQEISLRRWSECVAEDKRH
jgi:hypothetical protein